MARHRIVCTTQVMVIQAPAHTHVAQVGVGRDPDRAQQRLPVDHVLDAMRKGETFYTRSDRSGREASVLEDLCPHCRRTFLRSGPEAVRDNDLLRLRQFRMGESVKQRPESSSGAAPLHFS